MNQDIPMIYVRTASKFRLLPAVYVFFTQLSLIGVGVVADSQAMQWMGFLCILVIALGSTINKINNEKALTIPEARARLDELETNR